MPVKLDHDANEHQKIHIQRQPDAVFIDHKISFALFSVYAAAMEKFSHVTD